MLLQPIEAGCALSRRLLDMLKIVQDQKKRNSQVLITIFMDLKGSRDPELGTLGLALPPPPITDERRSHTPWMCPHLRPGGGGRGRVPLPTSASPATCGVPVPVLDIPALGGLR